MSGNENTNDELWMEIFEEWLAICDPVEDLPLDARLKRLTANVMEEISSSVESPALIPIKPRPSARL